MKNTQTWKRYCWSGEAGPWKIKEIRLVKSGDKKSELIEEWAEDTGRQFTKKAIANDQETQVKILRLNSN